MRDGKWIDTQLPQIEPMVIEFEQQPTKGCYLRSLSIE